MQQRTQWQISANSHLLKYLLLAPVKERYRALENKRKRGRGKRWKEERHDKLSLKRRWRIGLPLTAQTPGLLLTVSGVRWWRKQTRRLKHTWTEDALWAEENGILCVVLNASKGSHTSSTNKKKKKKKVLQGLYYCPIISMESWRFLWSVTMWRLSQINFLLLKLVGLGPSFRCISNRSSGFIFPLKLAKCSFNMLWCHLQ